MQDKFPHSDGQKDVFDDGVSLFCSQKLKCRRDRYDLQGPISKLRKSPGHAPHAEAHGLRMMQQRAPSCLR
jgi:hypothetical protein